MQWMDPNPYDITSCGLCPTFLAPVSASPIPSIKLYIFTTLNTQRVSLLPKPWLLVQRDAKRRTLWHTTGGALLHAAPPFKHARRAHACRAHACTQYPNLMETDIDSIVTVMDTKRRDVLLRRVNALSSNESPYNNYKCTVMGGRTHTHGFTKQVVKAWIKPLA